MTYISGKPESQDNIDRRTRVNQLNKSHIETIKKLNNISEEEVRAIEKDLASLVDLHLTDILGIENERV